MTLPDKARLLRVVEQALNKNGHPEGQPSLQVLFVRLFSYDFSSHCAKVARECADEVIYTGFV